MSARPETENEVAIFQRLIRDFEYARQIGDIDGMVKAGDALTNLGATTKSPTLQAAMLAWIQAHPLTKPDA